MIVFVAWPTCDVGQSNRTAELWLSRGYKVAVATTLPSSAISGIKASIPPLLLKKYHGYYQTMNAFCSGLVHDFRADIVIAGGDRVRPDVLRRGHDIAINFAQRFKNGMGVLQPIGGDRWKPNQTGQGSQEWGKLSMHATPAFDQRCASPWFGRTFILEANSGEGPYGDGYDQYFADVELHDVASEMGILWKREDVRQEHDHWARSDRFTITQQQRENFERSYEKDLGRYRARKAKGFPGAVVTNMGLGVNKPRLILPPGY